MSSGVTKRGSGNKTNTPGLPILDDTAATSATSFGRKPDEATSSSPEVTSAIEEGGVPASASGTGLMTVAAPATTIVAAVHTSPGRPATAERQTSGIVRVDIENAATTSAPPNSNH